VEQLKPALENGEYNPDSDDLSIHLYSMAFSEGCILAELFFRRKYTFIFNIFRFAKN
jgi:hypothetical protein